MLDVGETVKVIAFEGAMLIGLAKDNVFANVTLKKLEVEFLNVQNIPPCAVVVDAGVTMLLNPELRM